MKAIPDKVKSFVEKTNDLSPNIVYWVEYADLNHGKPVVRTFGYQRTKTYGLKVQEVLREYIDHNEINDCLYFYQLCGYRVHWKGIKKQNNYYCQEPTYKFSNCDLYRPNLITSRVQTKSEVIDIFKEFIPYFYISDILLIDSIIEYVRTYMDHPQLELLAKAGLDYFYKDKMMMKCNKSRMKQISQWLLKNIDYMRKYQRPYKFVSMALKNRENAQQCEFRCQTMNDMKYLKTFGFDYSYSEMLDINKYLKKQDCSLMIYRDYLDMSRKLERDLTDYSIRFPRMLMEQHDSLANSIDKKVNQNINKKLLKVYKKLNQCTSQIGTLKIVIPKTVADFKNWGKTLHNCVGSMSYDEKMTKGKCIIVGVFKGKNIVECCELSPELEIKQLYGDHNNFSKYHKKAEKLVNLFIKNLRVAGY